MSSTNATARGTLGNTPLGELLIFCLQRKLSGALVFDSEEFGRSALSLHQGVVTKAKLGSPACRLGQVCVSLEQIDEQLLAAALKSIGSSLFGKHLVDSLLLEESELELALGVQLHEQIQWCSELKPDTVYGYYEEDLLSRFGGPPRRVDPLSLIWRASRDSGTLARAQSICEGFGDRVLRLHADSRVGRFRFDDELRPALDVLRAKPQSFAELRASGLTQDDLLCRALALLALSQHLDLGGNATPLGVSLGDSRPPPQVPRQHRRYRRPEDKSTVSAEPLVSEASPAADERRTEIEQMAERAPSLSFYELLEVAPDADSSTIQQAFFQLARKWHPDKLGADLSDQRGAATRVFALMTEAHQVLTSSQQRAEYDRLVDGGKTTQAEQEQVQQILRAAASFQKAEILARRADWEAAEKAAEKAYRDDPAQTEYGALYAWVAANSKQRSEPGEYEALLAILKGAVKQQPENIRVRLYRARVFKLVGRNDLAIRDYRAVSDIEPNNVEAARELRLYRMRAGSTEEPDGLFGRLFKKS